MKTEHFKCYQPSMVTVVHKSALDFIPSSASLINIKIPIDKLPTLPQISSLTIQPNYSYTLPTSLKYFNSTSHLFLPDLPPLLTHLNFVVSDKINIKNWELPSSLTHVTLTLSGVGDLPSFPHSVTYLKVTGIKFTIEFPPFLKICKLRSSRVDTMRIPPLPSSLEHLDIMTCDNLELPEIIPDSLKILILSPYLTPLTHYPPNLIHLIDLSKDIPLPPFPSSLQILGLDEKRHLKLPLLPHLYKFIGGSNMINNLPPVTHLSLFSTHASSKIPPTVTHLTLNNYCFGTLPSLPPSLVHLSMNVHTIITLPQLPSTLQNLKIESPQGIFKAIISSFPPSLKVLEISQMDNFPPFPPTLQILNICDIGNLKNLPPLPPSLHTLCLSKKGKKIKLDIPSNLMHFSCSFEQFKAVEKTIPAPCDSVYMYLPLKRANFM